MSSRRSRPTRPPLEGRTVILTRAPADNRLLAERLVELGVRVEQIPMNQVEAPPDEGRALDRALTDLGSYQWVVFTSANGVRAVVDGRGAVDWPDGTFVAAVGEATAEIADAAGLPVHFIPSEATAATLVAEFPTALVPADGPKLKVLAPLAELASSTVEEGLEGKGYEVERVVAYATSAPAADPVREPALRAIVHGADAVVLTAPSAASRFTERFSVSVDGETRPPCLPAICIGPVTAKRATALGLTVVAVANPHNDDGLFDAVQWALVDQAG